MKKKFNILIFSLIVFAGCGKDDPVSGSHENLIFQRDGIIESFGGDCSAVQVRTSSLGIYDLAMYRSLKFSFSAFTDADLSGISIFCINNSETIYLMNLNDRDAINSTQTYTTESPEHTGELFIRFTLKSSVCTGQIFHIEMRDLKIFSIQ